ncbi:hypothetical protein UFOVP42_40 [uncultured Caudovirales phage]|uniref:DUF7936 domain-containing protein n=1 Tax=uncultured Caudovirales phage TaxID=2100421 RepID=A0A6J5KT10_9CAUD|nr:hypothetical protein UFOVP42_40 [uncultured Caudovirales phage]
MIKYEWQILSISENCASVNYRVTGIEGLNTVTSEGNHVFAEGTVNLPFAQIKQENIIDWLEKDTTQNGVSAIKLNLENQLKALKSNTKVDFPWLAGTFTPQV